MLDIRRDKDIDDIEGEWFRAGGWSGRWESGGAVSGMTCATPAY